MKNVIPFPESTRVNTWRNRVMNHSPARVVADFWICMIQANERKKHFHEIMNYVEIFGWAPLIDVTERESIQTMLVYTATEKLKNERYRLNFDVVHAILYITQLVVNELKEVEPWVFVAPELKEIGKNGTIFGELAILTYVFSPYHHSHPDLTHLKSHVHEAYLEFADYVWKTGRRNTENLEHMYAELAFIFPLVIDVIKAYMIPFQHQERLQLISNKNADQATLF